MPLPKPIASAAAPGPGDEKNLPDVFKSEVLKFQESIAGQALFRAIKARRPLFPFPSDSPHQMLRQVGIVEGYEKCLEEFLKLPQELQQDEPEEKPSALHLPQD